MSSIDTIFHRGLMAALNNAYHEYHDDDPPELRYYRSIIERSGQPALDAGCGNGRLLRWLLSDGFDVDGSDISPDMLEICRRRASAQGLSPRLYEQSTAALDLPRRYRTIVMNGSFGINGTRDDDVASFRRVLDHLEPDGTLAFDSGPEWASRETWGRASDPDRMQPTAWVGPSSTHTPGGNTIVDSERLVLVDPLEQYFVKDLCIDLVHEGRVVKTEFHRLVSRWYSPRELIRLLDSIGFERVEVFGDFTDEPAHANHEAFTYVARKSP